VLKKRFKLITVIVILLFFYCCVKTKTYISPNEDLRIRTLKKVIVKLKDGDELKLSNVYFKENKLIGFTKGKERKEIDFSLIESVRTEKTNYTYAVLLGGVFIITAALIYGASTAPAPPPSEWE